MAGQSPQWNATSRVLRRMGFGATGRTIDAVSQLDLPQYVDSALGGDPNADPGARSTPLPDLSYPVSRPGKSATKEQRTAFNKRLSADRELLSSWWIRRMLAVGQPVHEKLTLLWHNHFATSAAKVRYASMMAAQNEALRANNLGDFRLLAHTMLTDAAMVLWLDGQTNTAKAANENLAREFMELFALGHGNGYTESDVRAGARALTGWTIDKKGQATFTARRHDSSPKTLFGQTAPFDAAQFCDIVLSQPHSSRYIATRLWQQLASDAPPTAHTLERLVVAYGPERNLRALTSAILTDPEFLNGGPKLITTPTEWLVGAARTLNVTVSDTGKRTTITHTAHLDTVLKALGQQPFYPPSVGGWPAGRAWMSTSSAGIRFSAAEALAQVGDLSTIEQTHPTDRIDAVGYLIGVGHWTDSSAAALTPLISTPPRLVAAALNSPEYLTT